MKRLFCIGVLVVLALSGCEAGLTSNDESLTENEKFSFSDMYAKIKTLQEEVDRLKAANTELTEALEIAGEEQAGAASSLSSRIESLESTVTGHGNSINNNTDLIGNLDGDLSGLNSTFTGVTRISDPMTGKTTIRFSGVNVQIVSGSGYTNGVVYRNADGTANGLGNLIVGYNEARFDDGLPSTGDTNDRTGSHNIIVGSELNYYSYGGLVVGRRSTIYGRYSSVSGGGSNMAFGDHSSVSGGSYNTASGWSSSVCEGKNRKVTADYNID